MRKKLILSLVVLVVLLTTGIVLVSFAQPSWLPFFNKKRLHPFTSFVVEENKETLRMEAGVKGKRELAFENRADRAVTLYLDGTDCECVGLQICLTTDAPKGEEARENVPPDGKEDRAWHKFQIGGKGFQVPPRTNGLLRLTWQTRVVIEHVFWASLVLDDGKEQGRRRVEVPVQQIEIVSLRAAAEPTAKNVNIGVLNTGEERVAHFLLYSQTREHFTLTPSPSSDDPWVTYSALRPLSREELHEISEKTGVSLKSGYRADVKVRESDGKSRLDLGPLRRKVTWQSDVLSDYKVSAFIEGDVRGEVWLKEPDNKLCVDMGTIAPLEPSPVVFELVSRDPQLELTPDAKKTLEDIQVELLDGPGGKKTDNGKMWRVQVRFRLESSYRGVFPNPDRAGHDTPELCSVVFIVKRSDAKQDSAKQPARRLYVPVRGTVKTF